MDANGDNAATRDRSFALVRSPHAPLTTQTYHRSIRRFAPRYGLAKVTRSARAAWYAIQQRYCRVVGICVPETAEEALQLDIDRALAPDALAIHPGCDTPGYSNDDLLRLAVRSGWEPYLARTMVYLDAIRLASARNITGDGRSCARDILASYLWALGVDDVGGDLEALTRFGVSRDRSDFPTTREYVAAGWHLYQHSGLAAPAVILACHVRSDAPNA